MITVKNLVKDFGGKRALDGVDATIHEGEKVVVIGLKSPPPAP